jgi:hypothetical protein
VNARRRPAKTDSPGADLGKAALGGGGAGLLIKVLISHLPDSFPAKQLLADLVPWLASGATALVTWAYGAYRRRALRNDAEEEIQDAEEAFLNLLVDPALTSEQRGEVREKLADLRMRRANTKYETAVRMQEEVERERSPR